MGTSADRDGGKGGAWTPLKHAATDYAKSAGSGGGSEKQAERLIGRHVAVLGGARTAGLSAASGSTALSSLGGFLAAYAAAGLPQALESLGLAHLVGADRFDILDELVTKMSGDGDDLESQAARDAQCDVLDELFSDASGWDELTAVTLAEEGIAVLLTEFLARYIYNRIPAIGERLARILDPAAARQADERIVDMIRGLVELKLPTDAISGFDWQGTDGREFADDRISEIYQVLESFGDDDL